VSSRVVTRSPEETRRLGHDLARRLAPDGILLLSGDLGAGKTVLSQGLAEGLGIDPAEVQSPTFTLIREHRRGGEERPSFYHLDLYRLEPHQVEALGVEELLAGPGVKAIEWAERLPFPVQAAVRLTMRRQGEDEREILEA
jgi:tRNA threonylcarbamoyladenosine biosynthesis protein TsaE